MKGNMIDENFFANLKTPFLLIKNTSSTNDSSGELLSLSFFTGDTLVSPHALNTHQSFFGGLSFEGEPVFFETKNIIELSLPNKKLETKYFSKTHLLENLTPVEDFNHFDQMIHLSKNEFQNHPELLKFILHRKIKATFNQSLTLDALIDLIPPLDNNHEFFIFFDGKEVQLSFTPETLIEKCDDTIFTMALAGTISRGKTLEEDQELEKELLADPKNIEEQTIVAKSINDVLAPFCHNIKIEEKTIKKLRHVQHLMNHISASLKNPTSFFELLKTLHPTPALGGEPKELALKSIKKIEQHPRHFYGGAIGFVEKNRAHFLVNIRNFSFSLGENSLFIYGGAGILKNSETKSEWQETENKMGQFLNFFNQ